MAEDHIRKGDTKNALKQYKKVCSRYEDLRDYETASYFYNRCLELSKESKNARGEAKAYQGLGNCEEKVMNIFQAKSYLEMGLEKACDENLQDEVTTISTDLVRIYKIIAKDFQKNSEFDKAIKFFEDCLEACRKAKLHEEEAQCYMEMGIIHEQMGDLDQSVFFLNKFLDLCLKNNNK